MPRFNPKSRLKNLFSKGVKAANQSVSPLSVESLEPRMMLSAVNIFAAGATGQETLQLLVDGQVEAEFQNVGGSEQAFQRISYIVDETVSADQISIRFTNDAYDPSIGLDRNLIVDRIEVDGVTYQTEHPFTWTSSYYGDNGITSGYLGVETLNVNGQFNYSTNGASQETRSQVTVSASGPTGQEQFELLIDGEVAGTFQVSTTPQTFEVTSNKILSLDQVRVQFTNDAYDPSIGLDRNLIVESVSIADVQTGATTTVAGDDQQVFSNGTYTIEDGLQNGYGRGNVLHVNGYLQFADAEVRSIEGTGNNTSANLADAGSAESVLHRYGDHTPEYGGDGSGDQMYSDAQRANARDISNAVVSTSTTTPNSNFLNDLTWLWGQFIDHDLDLSTTEDGVDVNGGRTINSTDPNDILNPAGVPFTRSDYVIEDGYRQQVNEITSFIDASNVYGSDHERADALRTFAGGKLKTSNGDLLPIDVEVPNDGGGRPIPNLFVAGDIRANENVGLSSMHTLFVREHNRLADLIAAQNPAFDDEQIYQLARKLVGAELQLITYNEFLPALLGTNAPLSSDYAYDAAVNPAIVNSFAHAGYRFGHTMLSPALQLDSADGTNLGQISLRDAFFNPSFLQEDANRVEQLLQGAIGQRAQEVDIKLVDDVRNFLFGQPGAGGLDLASLNIQRGRDHGLPDYNHMREIYGLSRVNSFADITSDVDLQVQLSNIYDGDVDNIDAWVGGLAEDHSSDSAMGELFTQIIGEQFRKLRDGDRLFYLSDDAGLYSGGQLDDSIRDILNLDQLKLADIIRMNTGLNPHDNVFYSADGFQTLTVNAYGDETSELFRVLVDGDILGTFKADSGEQSFDIAIPQDLSGPSEVRVEFLNDQFDLAEGFDRNLIVTSIEIDSVVYQTNSPSVFSTGTWRSEDGVVSGFGRGNALHANGYFQFVV